MVLNVGQNHHFADCSSPLMASDLILDPIHNATAILGCPARIAEIDQGANGGKEPMGHSEMQLAPLE